MRQTQRLNPQKVFRTWYETAWNPWFPEDFKWHQFRFMRFNGRWVKIPKPRSRIRSKRQLARIIRSLTPKHAFYTVLKFIDPSAVGPPDITVQCLGGDLVFDLDAPIEPYNIDSEKYRDVAMRALRLTDFLRELGYREVFYVFSGLKGFHVHVRDFDPYEFLGKDRTQTLRLEIEAEARERIANLIHSHGVEVDIEVTKDVKRIVRLPNTLHGKSALITLFLRQHELERIVSDPLLIKERASPKLFNESTRVTILGPRINMIKFFDQTFTLRDKGVLPLQILLILTLNDLVDSILSPPDYLKIWMGI